MVCAKQGWLLRVFLSAARFPFCCSLLIGSLAVPFHTCGRIACKFMLPSYCSMFHVIHTHSPGEGCRKKSSFCLVPTNQPTQAILNEGTLISMWNRTGNFTDYGWIADLQLKDLRLQLSIICISSFSKGQKHSFKSLFLSTVTTFAFGS